MQLHMQIYFGDHAADGSVFALLIWLAILPFVWRKSHNLSYLFCFALFSLYIIYALDKIYFPLPISGIYADSLRTHNARYIDNLHLIPFYFGRFGTLQSSIDTLLLNILLTMPFGFGINFLKHIRAKHFLWIAPALGIGLEVIQLGISFMLGFIYRVIDINDVLMNMLGVWIGYAAFRLFICLYLGFIRALKFKSFGIFNYVYEMGLRVEGE